LDKLSAERRSANMRQIRSKNTAPEILLRRMLHRQGYRFRLHRKELPGKPDIVFPSRRKAIFVHGCFWHQHSGCREGRIPRSRREYWEPKLTRNRQRDDAAQVSLNDQGWQTLVMWECELKDTGAAMKTARRFLERKNFAIGVEPRRGYPHCSD
jgi:DNA mismatch endonuclease (patch repair protein)